MTSLVGKLTKRIRKSKDELGAMRQAQKYASAHMPGGPLFHIDRELRWHSMLRSLLQVLDSRMLQPSKWVRVSDNERAQEYNRWVKTGFVDDETPTLYRGKGFCLELPKDFPNAASVIVNDLREVYLENRYSCLFPFGCLVNDGDVVIDCGASIGAFAVHAASLGPHVKVLAFEPESVTFKTLCRNIEINGLSDQVQCFPYGLAAREGRFVLTRNENEFTMHKLANPEHSLGTGETNLADQEQIVRCVTIDQILSEVGDGRCDVIKMDIEGAEHAALQGAVETIRRYHPRLTIAAYHHLVDPYILSVMVREILPDCNVLVSGDVHLYAFV